MGAVVGDVGGAAVHDEDDGKGSRAQGVCTAGDEDAYARGPAKPPPRTIANQPKGERHEQQHRQPESEQVQRVREAEEAHGLRQVRLEALREDAGRHDAERAKDEGAPQQARRKRREVANEHARACDQHDGHPCVTHFVIIAARAADAGAAADGGGARIACREQREESGRVAQHEAHEHDKHARRGHRVDTRS